MTRQEIKDFHTRIQMAASVTIPGDQARDMADHLMASQNSLDAARKVLMRLREWINDVDVEEVLARM